MQILDLPPRGVYSHERKKAIETKEHRSNDQPETNASDAAATTERHIVRQMTSNEDREVNLESDKQGQVGDRKTLSDLVNRVEVDVAIKSGRGDDGWVANALDDPGQCQR